MAKKRQGLSKRTRFEVFKRDRFACQYCGRTPPMVVLQVDHILAVSDGGTDERTNLLTACQDCNGGKSNVPLSMIPDSLASQIQERMEAAEQVKAFNKFLLSERNELVASVRRLGMYWYNLQWDEQNKLEFGSERQASIRIFLKSLPEVEILGLMDVAYSRHPCHPSWDEKTWRYFCGCCWRQIKGDDRAAQKG